MSLTSVDPKISHFFPENHFFPFASVAIFKFLPLNFWTKFDSCSTIDFWSIFRLISFNSFGQFFFVSGNWYKTHFACEEEDKIWLHLPLHCLWQSRHSLNPDVSSSANLILQKQNRYFFFEIYSKHIENSRVFCAVFHIEKVHLLWFFFGFFFALSNTECGNIGSIFIHTLQSLISIATRTSKMRQVFRLVVELTWKCMCVIWFKHGYLFSF